MFSKYPDFYDYHIERLREPKAAISYIKTALADYEQDHDMDALMQAIVDVEISQGGAFGLQRLLSKPAKKKTVKKPSYESRAGV